MPVPPIDIERTAKVMLGEYEDEAYAVALDRVHKLEVAGDREGVHVFSQIAEAIHRLNTTANDNGGV